MKFECSQHIFETRSNIQISRKSDQWAPSCSIQPAGRTDMTKLNVAFRNSANARDETGLYRTFQAFIWPSVLAQVQIQSIPNLFMTPNRPTLITTRTVQLGANIHHHRFLKSSVYVRRGTPVLTTVYHTGLQGHYSVARHNSTADAPIIQTSISSLLNGLNGFQCDPMYVCFPGITTHCGCIFTAR
jgi:hypothetical protein